MSILTDKVFLVLRKEAAWATYDTGGTDLPHPFYNGTYGVTLKDPVRIQPHIDGSLLTSFGVQDVRDLDGAVEVGLYPDTAGALLDWLWKRDGTSGDGESYSGTLIKPGLEGWRDLGLKVGGGSLNFADGDDLRLNLTLRGRYRTDVAFTGSPPALPARGDFTWPTIPSYTFANLRFLVSLDAGAVSPVEVAPVGLESGTINFQNNLIPGQHVQDLVTAEQNGILEYLLSGAQSLDGSFVVLLDRDDYHDGQYGKKEVSLRIMGTHQTADYTTVSAPATAGSNVSITVASSAAFAAGEYVFFRTTDATKMSVARIKASGGIPDGTHIVVETLDKDVAAASYVFNKAIEFYLPRGKLSEVSDDFGPGGVVKATLNFTSIGEDGTTELFQYQAGGMA